MQFKKSGGNVHIDIIKSRVSESEIFQQSLVKPIISLQT